MENNYVEINRSLYGGKNLFSKKLNNYELDTITCCNKNCALYKSGQCVMATRRIFSNAKCPYGNKNTIKGPSSRSSRYSDLRNTYYELEKTKPLLELKQYNNIFAVIGDYYYFNISVIDFYYNNITSEYIALEPWTYTERNDLTRLGVPCFIKKTDIPDPVKFFSNLIQLQPWALFTREPITDFQDKVVPQLKLDILRWDIELSKSLGLSKDTIDYVGMLAQLNTLNPSINCKLKDVLLYWDGTSATVLNPESVIDNTHSHSTWSSYIGNISPETVIKFIPGPNCYVKIEDNSWVNDDTIIKKD